MTVCEWNVRHEIEFHETDIKLILSKEVVDVMFLTEVDSRTIHGNFNIENYDTHYQKIENGKKTRIVCLTKAGSDITFVARPELMSKLFPSIWIEARMANKKKYMICGFYREWAPDKIGTIEAQAERINILTEQISRAANMSEKVIIIGDANLCMDQWDDDKYRYKRISDTLKECLLTNGFKIGNIGKTYHSDHATAAGEYVSSAIDHVYYSESCCMENMEALDYSGTDHDPIAARVNVGPRLKEKYIHYVNKRTF